LVSSSFTVEWQNAQVNADRGEAERLALVVEEALHADHSPRLEQLERRLLLVQADRAALDRGGEDLGQLIDVDLESQRERLSRGEPRSHAAPFLAQDRLVESELPAPEVLVAECLPAEDFPAVVDQLLRRRVDRVAEIGVVGPDGAILRRAGRADGVAGSEGQRQQHRDQTGT
jgi:hypothetical protein